MLEVAEGRPLTLELLESGKSLSKAILERRLWCHRKVESFDLLPGRRGRRRVSLDCSPREILWIEEGSALKSSLIPLTYMSKGTLRDLDVRTDSGESLPVLGTIANGLIAAAAIAYLVSADKGFTFAQKHWILICRVTMGPKDEAERLGAELLGEVQPDVATAALIRDLARNFLLMAVVPPAVANRRQVIKYSGLVKMVSAGLGFVSFDVTLEMNYLDSAHGYHLECKAPFGLLCDSVQLPPDSTKLHRTDEVRTSVGHAHGNYGWDAAKDPEDAVIRFVLDPTVLLPRVFWSAFGVTALFAALLVLPTAYSSLTSKTDAATALFLFIPALLIALGARGPENDVVARLLLTLRTMAYVLSILLFGVGVMLVLEMPEAVMEPSWWVSGIIGLVIAVLSLCGWARLKVTGRR
jgi:hypothetical protein